MFSFTFPVDYTFMLHFCFSSHEHPELVNSGNIHEKCIHSFPLGATAENMDVAMVISYEIIEFVLLSGMRREGLAENL